MLRWTQEGRHLRHQPGSDPYRLDRGVVGEHRDHDLRIECLGSLARQRRTPVSERLDRSAAAVIHGELVSGIEQSRRHSAAHLAQSNESDLHLAGMPWEKSGLKWADVSISSRLPDGRGAIARPANVATARRRVSRRLR
jgi:hypothetical protein